jgi:hypothetical protein
MSSQEANIVCFLDHLLKKEIEPIITNVQRSVSRGQQITIDP